jgi:hypothetical protein
MRRRRYFARTIAALALCAAPIQAGPVDQQKAAVYFKEAAALCEREGGKLWGVSLCGPMVFADAASHTIATNQPEPEAKRPPTLGFANSAVDWGGTRWSTFVWQFIPDNEHNRARLMMHELFHRVQPQLGLMLNDGHNEHLDTLEGRYWIQLEWRALAKALGSTGEARLAATRDALAFRSERHRLFPEAQANERPMEINEGLAQYTGTVAASSWSAEAIADAIDQLGKAEQNATFVRTFPYASGAAYGLLLDNWSPGWRQRLKSSDDLAALVMAAAKIERADGAVVAATRYGGESLHAAEERRDAEHKARVAELRKRFVDGPVLTTPRARNTAFSTAGMTPIPGAGTVYPDLHATGDWGSLDATMALMLSDQGRLVVPAPASVEGTTISGDGWTLKLTPGWVVIPGNRPADYIVAKPK